MDKRQFYGYLRQYNNETGWGQHWELVENATSKLITNCELSQEEKETAEALIKNCIELEENRKKLLELLKKGFKDRNS